MSMIDYGAVVKKNGKIITDPKGELFQNYTNLKYTEQYLYNIYYDENDEPAIVEPGLNPDYIDETLVKRKVFNTETFEFTDEVEDYSMANNMALVGDEQFLIGFYKQSLEIAVDKILIEDQNIVPLVWKWFYEHKKPLVIKLDNIPELSDIVINMVNRNLDHLESFFAKFTYKGDKYEVLFGYGIDPKPIFLYGKQSYLYHYKERYYYNGYYFESVHRFPGRVINKEDRRSLNIIKKWYEAGI